MKNNNKKDDTKIINIVTSIIGILLIVLTVSLMYAFYKSNVLKLSYIIVIGIIVLLIDTLLIVKLENKNKSKYKRYVTSFISLIFVFIYGIIISYIIDTVKFVSNISKINNYEYQTYDRALTYIVYNNTVYRIERDFVDIDNNIRIFVGRQLNLQTDSIIDETPGGEQETI